MARTIVSVTVVVVVIAAAAVLVTVVMLGGTASGTSCATPAPGAAQGLGALDAEQVRTVQVILSVADQRGLPPRASVIAVSTGIVESKLRNLDHGDRDSLGVFQQRPSQGWGTPAQVTNVVYAAGKFFDGLIALRGWESMPPGQAAQAVQRSGFPGRYAPEEGRAAAIVAEVRGQAGILPDPCVPSGVVDAPGAVGRALSQIGMPYCWGGGTTSGPTRGDGTSPPPCGPSTPGFDCSGLMLYAFAPGATLPRTSRMQYRTPGSTQVPVSQAQPGDLLFWANNTANAETIHHVALVVKPGELVEAPENGKTVRQRPYSLDSAGLMPSAVRVGA
ncbi:C40 family peptidase [Amycolatopsis azurea]|uniref:C40 family peptidase n=1 Tax=Amycolatopsis azurea TaxID=36819 RepID=UPI0037FCB032